MEYFIRNDKTLMDHFHQAVYFLQSPGILPMKELERWQKKGMKAVAQTIDGDYVIQVGKKIKVVPMDLHESDIETYPLTEDEFFKEYWEGKIHSKILAPVRKAETK